MKQAEAYNINGVSFPKLNQIGILVKDISEAVRYYSKLLGIGPWFRSKTVKHDLVFRDKPIRIDLDIVIAFRGGMEYELIQVLGGDECIYSEILRKNGGGIHHMGAVVWDFDKRLANVKEAGIGVIQSGTITTKGAAVTNYAYLDTVAQCGIITELIETKLMGIHVPQNSLMMHIGLVTGDVEMLKVSI
jgi:catechol 2,3-dioxygenase-like lactoylglutathione lyase family enzyme